jgi:hypothetical protein
MMTLFAFGLWIFALVTCGAFIIARSFGRRIIVSILDAFAIIFVCAILATLSLWMAFGFQT